MARIARFTDRDILTELKEAIVHMVNLRVIVLKKLAGDVPEKAISEWFLGVAAVAHAVKVLERRELPEDELVDEDEDEQEDEDEDEDGDEEARLRLRLHRFLLP